jgi:hypothetical protein
MASNFTNNDFLKYYKENGEKKTVEYLLQISTGSKDINSIRSAVKRTVNLNKNLNKNKSKQNGPEKINEFEISSFDFPQKQLSKRKPPSESEDVDLATKSKFRLLMHSLKETAVDCIQESETLRKEVEDLKKTPKVVKQVRLRKWKTLANTSKKELSRVKRSYDLVKSNNKAKMAVIKRLKLKLNYREKQNSNLQDKINSMHMTIENLEEENNNLKVQNSLSASTNKELLEENDWLREMICPNVETFDVNKKCFTSDLQECVYALLTCNVSSSQVSPIIAHVLKLANKEATKLPSRSTVNNMNVQRLILSQKQLGEEFVKKENTCLLSDETSKYGHKYQGMHAADAEGQIWALGIREMTTKSGQSVLGVLQDILGDIEHVSEGSEGVSKEILLNISSTMSDRASTQLKFNELLEEFRGKILQEKMADAWEQLSASEQQSLSRLCNFFVHSICLFTWLMLLHLRCSKVIKHFLEPIHLYPIKAF